MSFSRTDAAYARSQLKLRWNPTYNCWEVYTCVHGTHIYKWWRISGADKDWYVKNFPGIQVLSTPETFENQKGF